MHQQHTRREGAGTEHHPGQQPGQHPGHDRCRDDVGDRAAPDGPDDDQSKHGARRARSRHRGRSGEEDRGRDARGGVGPGRGQLQGAIAVTGQTEFLFVDATHLDTHATLKLGQQSLETVSKGGQLYIKGLPPASSGGKPWVRIDPKATDPLSKAMAGAVQQAGSPQSLSDAFNGSSATVVDTANGQTHYRLAGGQTGSGDLYVDGQNRPVRFLADASGTKVQVAYSDWGAPVTITVPPADQVGSLAPGG